MATKIIKALLVEPGKHPKTTYIPLSKNVFNDIVSIDSELGSHTSTFKINDDVAAIYNGDGLLHDLPGNRRLGNKIIAGVFLIVAVDPFGHIRSMPNDILLKYKSMLWYPEQIPSSEIYRSHFDYLYQSLDEPEFS